ncbi:MAG: type II toxin-antitoxin system VapC family toxin [Nitrososphaera sp.]
MGRQAETDISRPGWHRCERVLRHKPGARHVPIRETLRPASRLLQASIFVDTSAFYALADRSDRFHSSAKRFLETNTSVLITSNLVVHETITLVRMRLGHSAAVQFGRRLFDEALTPLLRVIPS